LKQFWIPGKIFLIGEYSVIEGGTAILAALKPGYGFKVDPESGKPHPESPYGIYLKEFPEARDERVGLFDRGLGPGFGSSTAELLAGVASFLSAQGSDGVGEASRVLAWYQDRFPKASGADLAIQGVSQKGFQGVYSFKSRSEIGSHPLSSEIAQRIFIYKGRDSQKLATHVDLNSHAPKSKHGLNRSRCDAWATEFLSAIQGGSDFDSLNQFADHLAENGLETPYAHEVRIGFQSLPGVIAVKGCGAGLNDVFIVVLDSTRAYADPATDPTVMGLRKVADVFGLSFIGTLGDYLW